MVTIQLPSQLAALAEGKTIFRIEASSIPEALNSLDTQAPMVRSQIFHPDGTVRQFIGLFLDDRQLDDEEWATAPLRPESTLLIIMSVAGG